MKFFSINNSLDKNVLCHYPQTKDINYNCHVWDEPKFIEHVHFEKVDFENELNSPVLNELFGFENVVFSPHVAGWTTQSYYKLSWYLAQKIKDKFF